MVNIVSPLNVRLLGAHQPLSAGRRYDLLCQSAGSRPPAAITWWQDGHRLQKTTETVCVYVLCISFVIHYILLLCVLVTYMNICMYVCMYCVYMVSVAQTIERPIT